MLPQNRSARGKTVTEKPGKSKSNEISQVRAQKPGSGLRSQGQVPVARKNIPETQNRSVRKITTTTNITKTS